MKRKYVLIVAMIIAICAISTSASGSVPSAAAPPAVHSVWSIKPLSIFDATIGQLLSVQNGDVVVSWTTEPLLSGDRGFYDAIVYANGTRYEIRLTQFNFSTPNQISGIFDIYKNNTLVASGPGDVLGLSAPVGGTFQFISSSSPWLLDAVDTSRIDF